MFVYFTDGVSSVAHVSSVVRALSVLYDQDVFGAGSLVLQPALCRDVQYLAVPVPHHPGPGLSRHHTRDLRLKPAATLEDVLLQ